MSDLRNEAIIWMTQMIADNPYLTATALAEGAAIALDQEPWLDSETHWIWEIAADIRGNND